MVLGEEQKTRMCWILFWVFVIAFSLIVLGTLSAVFLGLGAVRDAERDVLVKVFIAEIGVAVIALFYSLFGLTRGRQQGNERLRLDFAKEEDIRKLVGMDATLTVFRRTGEPLYEKAVTILDENGPYIPLDLPTEAHNVHVRVSVAGTPYSGSLPVGVSRVDLEEEV